MPNHASHFGLNASLIALAFGMAACSSGNFQPKPLPLGVKQEITVIKTGRDGIQSREKITTQSLSAAFLAAQDAAYAERNSPTVSNLRTFLESGMNLSDELANQWLGDQYAKDTDSRFAHDTANTALGVATTAVGIAEGSAKSVALLGAGTVGLNTQWGNYEAAYLLSTALPKVIAKLKEFRASLREELLGSVGASTTYDDVVRMLMGYHDTASRQYVKLFIERSAELAKFSTGNSTSLASDRQFVEQSGKLFSALNPPNGKGFYRLEEVAILVGLATETKDSTLDKAIRSVPLNAALGLKLDTALATAPAGGLDIRGQTLEALRALGDLPAVSEAVANMKKKAEEAKLQRAAYVSAKAAFLASSAGKTAPSEAAAISAEDDLGKAVAGPLIGIRQGRPISVQVVPVE